MIDVKQIFESALNEVHEADIDLQFTPGMNETLELILRAKKIRKVLTIDYAGKTYECESHTLNYVIDNNFFANLASKSSVPAFTMKSPSGKTVTFFVDAEFSLVKVK